MSNVFQNFLTANLSPEKKYSKKTCKLLAGYFFLRTFAPFQSTTELLNL